MAGGKNIIEAEGWPVISIEDVVDKNPQIIICSGMGGGSYTIMEAITGNQILAQTDAVKNNKVYPVDDPNTIELARLPLLRVTFARSLQAVLSPSPFFGEHSSVLRTVP